MKAAFDPTPRCKSLVVAQLLALAYFALGLAFAWYPIAGVLFLFAVFAPVLVSGAVILLAKHWIVAYQCRQTRRQVVQRTQRLYPVSMAG